jgi:hypothetical protein
LTGRQAGRQAGREAGRQAGRQAGRLWCRSLAKRREYLTVPCLVVRWHYVWVRCYSQARGVAGLAERAQHLAGVDAERAHRLADLYRVYFRVLIVSRPLKKKFLG